MRCNIYTCYFLFILGSVILGRFRLHGPCSFRDGQTNACSGFTRQSFCSVDYRFRLWGSGHYGNPYNGKEERSHHYRFNGSVYELRCPSSGLRFIRDSFLADERTKSCIRSLSHWYFGRYCHWLYAEEDCFTGRNQCFCDGNSSLSFADF